MTYKSNQNKPAPSNSRLSVYERDTPSPYELKMGWDRMTVIGNLKDEEAKNFRDFCATNPLVDIIKSATDLLHAKMHDGTFYVEYDKLKGKSRGRRNIRVEFNPSKCTEVEKSFFTKEILPRIEDVGFSRLDLAFDINVNLSEFNVLPGNPVKENVFYGRDGSVETIYMGSRESEKYIRIYDKRQEQEDKGISSEDSTWWRLEFELKRQAVDEWNLVFEDVLIKKPDWKTLNDVKEKAMVYMLLNEKGEWGNLSRKTRYKYRGLIRDLAGEDLTVLFQNALMRQRNILREELESWIGCLLQD